MGHDSAPVQLQQSADGRTLYVYSPNWYDNSQSNGMLLVNTSTGETTAKLDVDSGDGGATIYTLADIYHDDWGQAPHIAGAAGSDSNGGSFASAKPFPRLEVSVDRAAIISGDSLTVTARYVDPQSGAALDPDSGDVDYHAPDSIRAVLSHGTAHEDDVTVVLTGDGYGSYHGTAQLTTPGAWDVRVKAVRAGEPNRSASRAERGGGAAGLRGHGRPSLPAARQRRPRAADRRPGLHLQRRLRGRRDRRRVA